MDLNVLSEPTTKKRAVITSWPKDIEELKGLTSLVLDGVEIIPPSIGELSNLKSLKIIGYGRLEPLPSEIGKLTGLKALNIRDGRLSGLPSQLGSLINLTSLVIECERLQYFQSEILDLPNLKLLYAFLFLDDKKIKRLINIRKLRCGIDDGAVFGQLAHPEKLDKLDIYINSLAISPEIGKLINLTSLKLEAPNNFTIPVEIGMLTNLRSLEIKPFSLDSIPEEISELKNLQELTLVIGKFPGIPPFFGKLTSLKTLKIETGTEFSFPSEIINLDNLKKLEIRYSSNSTISQSSKLPPEIFLFPKLEILSLIGFTGNKLPAEIAQLMNLRSLTVDVGFFGRVDEYFKVKIFEIPDSIGNLINLEKLDISAVLKSLPVSLCQLENLQQVDIESGEVNFPNVVYKPTVPLNFGKLRKLRTISIYRPTMRNGIGFVKDSSTLQTIGAWKKSNL